MNKAEKKKTQTDVIAQISNPAFINISWIIERFQRSQSKGSSDSTIIRSQRDICPFWIIVYIYPPPI